MTWGFVAADYLHVYVMWDKEKHRTQQILQYACQAEYDLMIWCEQVITKRLLPKPSLLKQFCIKNCRSPSSDTSSSVAADKTHVPSLVYHTYLYTVQEQATSLSAKCCVLQRHMYAMSISQHQRFPFWCKLECFPVSQTPQAKCSPAMQQKEAMPYMPCRMPSHGR